MTVHGRSYVQYWSTSHNTYQWLGLEAGDLNRLELVDSVYQPMRVHMVISNADMNHKLSDDSDVASGLYTVEGEVSNPTFRRFQPIRIFHVPRGLYTDTATHNGNGSEITFTLNSHGLGVGDFIDVMNESTGAVPDGKYKIKAVTTNTFTLYRKGTASTSAASQNYAYNVTGTGDTGTIVIISNSQHHMYPIFFGRISALDVSYSDQVGKSISIKASDYLANLSGEIITRSFTTPPPTPENFTTTSLEVGTEDGKYQDVSYDNQKLSDTVKEILTDWSYGRTLYTDNTYDGTNSLGESKFEDSSFVFAAADDASVRRFGGRDTKVLDAIKNVAMTERHSAEVGAEGNAGSPEAATYYWVNSGSTTYGSGNWAISGSGKDVVIEEVNHGYVNGNLVEFYDSAGTHVHASYIVANKTDDFFKIKTLEGDYVQGTAAGSGVACTIAPGKTGSFGYDFYLDTGLYASTVGSNDLDSHRPHLNYFLRGSRPIDPETTGLTLQYPQGYDESADVFGWGTATSSGRINTTKVHLMPHFDHGMYAEDLYSHVGLKNVDTDDREEDIGDLGHKLEMLKVNSISNEDYVAQLSSGHEEYSGKEQGKGLFHWERDDSSKGLGWRDDGEGTSAGRANNIDYFSGTSGAHYADGTHGALTHNTRNNNTGPWVFGGAGNSVHQSVLGLGGLSRVPDGRAAAGAVAACPENMGVGRPFLDPPSTNAEKDKNNSDYGATALTAADLIKDVYNVEQEGLLGPVVQGTHDAGTSVVTITKADHTLETGNIIKITQINSGTSNVGGLTVNAAPTRVNEDAVTTATGSYYRVKRVSEDTFNITACQTHRSNLATLGFSSSTTGTFHYQVAYNVFKHACRVQWASGHTWSTKTEDTVLRTETTGKGADYLVISDVRKADKPYKGIQVNALVANSTENPATTAHPTSGVFGYTTVPHTNKITNSFETMPRLNESTSLTPNPDAAASDFSTDSKVTVKFQPGDYISETRFLYSDDSLTGVIGRDQAATDSAEGSSNDVFKSTKAKILSRMVNQKNVSKTYTLQYNDSAASRDTVRDTVAQILKRVIIPAKRTTCKIFGYPVIKLTGAAQSGTTASSLVPIDNPVAYGGRAGMMVEKTTGLDGPPADLTHANSVTSAAVVGGLYNGGEWGEGDYYRMFIYLRAGNSVRVEHTAAGVKGNHIITKLTYYERMGTTETSIETTGYDEALIAKFGPLSELIATIKRSGDSRGEPRYVTPKKLSADPFSFG